MKTRCSPPLCLLALACALVAGPPGTSRAQDAAPPVAGPSSSGSGSISGRVRNVVSGQFLNNVRASIPGSDLVAYTDPSGTFRLPRVPSGAVVLEIFHTGFDVQRLPLTIAPGQHVERDIDLTSVARYGEASATVKLDSFVVSTARETDGEAIAINEQRFAANIKNVMATDAIGEVMDGNVGEFLKFMPGITAEYDLENGNSVASVSVRGFPTSMSNVSTDGAQLANTGNAQGNSRVFQFSQVSINNLSRLEVTKVPTPSSPADSLAGSVNMVTKSAFERKDAELRYNVSLSATRFGVPGESLTLGKVPHTSDRKIRKILPSYSFDYTLPVTRTFGLVLTANSMNRFMRQLPLRKVYNATAAGTGASFERPYLQQFQFVTAPRVNERNSLGVRADWQLHRGGVLSVNAESSRYESDRASVDMQFDAGTNAAPTPATGTRLSFDEDTVTGATGRGAVTMMGTAAVKQTLKTTAGNARYRFDNGDWRVEASLGHSSSQGGYQDTAHGHFRQFGIVMAVPVRVTFDRIVADRPQSIQVFDNSNREVDFHDPRNFRLNTANTTPRDIHDSMVNAKLDVRKSLAALPFPAALQLGGLQRRQTRDVRRQSVTLTYNGVGGDLSPAPYRFSTYVNQDEGSGFTNMPWISPYKVWEAYQANPALFTKTNAQAVAEETFRMTNSEFLQEAVSAAYLQAEAGLLHNRLKVLTGVRFEQTNTKGEGVRLDPAAVFQRNAAGGFLRDAAGNRIRKPEAGAAGSMEELRLIRQERAHRADRTYDGYYPSVHLTYTVRENFLVRAAYAKTYGRPDLTNIVPNTSITESDLDDNTADPNALRGRIAVRNTGLRPWTADNYDLSLEYYTPQGGLLSAGAFRKEIDGFFDDEVKLATADDLEALGLDPRYLGWQLSTKRNLNGTARVSGVEFNVRHSLRPLGAWGRPFQVFWNGTKLRLSGSQETDFSSFLPTTMNAGLNFSRKPVSAMLKWNYRGKQRRGAWLPLGADAFEHIAARSTVDASLDYQIRSKLFLFVTVQNLFNASEVLLRYGSATPAYATQHRETVLGTQISLGLKGTF